MTKKSTMHRLFPSSAISIIVILCIVNMRSTKNQPGTAFNSIELFGRRNNYWCKVAQDLKGMEPFDTGTYAKTVSPAMRSFSNIFILVAWVVRKSAMALVALRVITFTRRLKIVVTDGCLATKSCLLNGRRRPCRPTS